MLRLQSLPRSEDVGRMLNAAREEAEIRYQGPNYMYVRKALCEVFDNSIGWLSHDIEPSIVLLEALQDEFAILDRHNRMQARVKPGRANPWSIPEALIQFPLRFVCFKDGEVKLPAGFFERIYQVEDISKSPSPTSSELSAARRVYSIGKLSEAPSPTHDFPDGNFTLAEIAAFLPHSIKSWDVADRILWNGAASEDLALMFNNYRGLSPRIDINSVYLMFRGQMRKRTEAEHGYTSWKRWVVSAQEDVQKPVHFDTGSISVAGFRRPVIFQNKPNMPAKPTPFKDLANGIAEWPTGYDALDLTRCVRWCADHPDAELYYPTDYQAVLKHVGGPLIVNTHHSDGQVLARLRSRTCRTLPRRRANRNYSYSKVAGEDSQHNRPRKRKLGDSLSYTSAKRRKSTVVSPRILRQTASRTQTKKDDLLNLSSEEDTDDDTYQGPKRMMKNNNEPRRSERINTKTTSYVDDGADDMDE